jgi:hypothetical protein
MDTNHCAISRGKLANDSLFRKITNVVFDVVADVRLQITENIRACQVFFRTTCLCRVRLAYLVPKLWMFRQRPAVGKMTIGRLSILADEISFALVGIVRLSEPSLTYRLCLSVREVDHYPI